MIRVIANLIFPIIGFILNSTILEQVKLHGVKPDLFIVIVVCIAVLRNDIEGSLLGFVCGIIRDIFFGKSLGFFALLYMLTGYLCGRPFKYFYRENYFVPMLLCFCATIFFESCVFILKFFKPNDFIYAFGSIIFPQSVYNTILILIFYPLIYLLNKQLENYEINRRKFI